MITQVKGGPGSGDHGHAGRPGQVGGSSGGWPATPLVLSAAEEQGQRYQAAALAKIKSDGAAAAAELCGHGAISRNHGGVELDNLKPNGWWGVYYTSPSQKIVLDEDHMGYLQNYPGDPAHVQQSLKTTLHEFGHSLGPEKLPDLSMYLAHGRGPEGIAHLLKEGESLDDPHLQGQIDHTLWTRENQQYVKEPNRVLEEGSTEIFAQAHIDDYIKKLGLDPENQMGWDRFAGTYPRETREVSTFLHSIATETGRSAAEENDVFVSRGYPERALVGMAQDILAQKVWDLPSNTYNGWTGDPVARTEQSFVGQFNKVVLDSFKEGPVRQSGLDAYNNAMTLIDQFQQYHDQRQKEKRAEIEAKLENWEAKGGEGSGFFSHSGRPGSVGGSAAATMEGAHESLHDGRLLNETAGVLAHSHPGSFSAGSVLAMHLVNAHAEQGFTTGDAYRNATMTPAEREALSKVPTGMAAAMEYIRTLPYEVGIAYDKDGNELFRDTQLQEDTVTLGSTSTDNLKGAIFLHNHPEADNPDVSHAGPENHAVNVSFSPPPGDIGLAHSTEVAEMVLVSRDYTYRMRPPDGRETFPRQIAPEVKKTLIDGLWDVHQNLGGEVEAGRMTWGELQEVGLHSLWGDFADQTGYRYERTPRAGSKQVERVPDGATEGVAAAVHRLHASARAMGQEALERALSAKGSATSGNFGHAGRPGQVGGSAPADGFSTPEAQAAARKEMWHEGSLTIGSETLASMGAALKDGTAPASQPLDDRHRMFLNTIEAQMRNEKGGAGGKVEIGYMIDKDGFPIETFHGDATTVPLPGNADGRFVGATFTHNHPNQGRLAGGPLSGADLCAAMSYELSEIRAVDKSNTYSFKAPPGGWNASLWKEYGDWITNAPVLIGLRAQGRSQSARAEAAYTGVNQLWANVARKMGGTYTVTSNITGRSYEPQGSPI